MLKNILCLATVFLSFSSFSSDLISHKVAVHDTRLPLPRKQAFLSHIEVLEMPLTSKQAQSGVLLLIPGFFQNANCFDLLPEKNISIARYLMKKFGLKIYLLNVRGLGKASSGKRLSLDDFAIDDIPSAIEWVSKKEKTKILVLGHSQGEHHNCFKDAVAVSRQSLIKGIALSGSNVAMTTKNPKSHLLMMGRIGKWVAPVLYETFDRIHVADLVESRLFSEFAYLKPWEFLYHRPNVSHESMLALYQRTLDNSWSGVVIQYIEGINNKGLKSKGPDGGTFYGDKLKNISVPTVSVVYGLDPMAEPETTFRDDFLKLGSKQKKFFKYEQQGHEDFMMVEALHSDWENPIQWLTSRP
jgi:pimeloyl-ACP methyl ester carboxylesterase